MNVKAEPSWMPTAKSKIQKGYPGTSAKMKAEPKEVKAAATDITASMARCALVCHPTEEEYKGLVSAMPSRKHRKQAEAFARNENRCMKAADTESELQREFARPKTASTSSTDGNVRPFPRFAFGQSVHHFWAAWMSEQSDEPAPLQQKQGKRPKWYSALVQAQPMWGSSYYGRCPYEGWHYRAH
jgi:hypothetical protein